MIVGLTPAEIAASLGLAHGSVHVLANRAMASMRAMLLAETAAAS